MRILCNSILNNNSILTADNVGATAAFAGLNAIKLPLEKLIVKLRAGDEVALSEADFVRLSNAFFAEIERRDL